MDRVVAKFKDYKEADRADREYYLRLPPSRDSISCWNSSRANTKETMRLQKDLRRVYRMVKLEQNCCRR